MLKNNLSLALLVCLLILYCGSGEDTYTVEVIDGTKYIKNISAAWGDESKIRLEHVRTIGEIDGENEALMLYYPSDIYIDSNGLIYIVDAGNYKVKVFNEDLNLIRSFGEQGEGPGEFRSPSEIMIKDNQSIYVRDIQKIEKFTINGDYIETVRPIVQSATNIYLPEYDKYLLRYSFYTFPGMDHKKLAALADTDGNTILEIGEKIYTGDDINKMRINEYDITISPDSYIYFTLKYKNIIEKYSMTGQFIYRTERPLNYPVEDERQYSYQGQELSGPSAINRGFGFDSKGRVWMMTNKKQFEDGFQIPDFIYFHVFNSEGIFLGEVEHPPCEGVYTRVLRIFGDRLFLIDMREMSVIEEYKIIEK
ncbi:6-bladed beta-propeller [candidate division KSB1 bacterium]